MKKTEEQSNLRTQDRGNKPALSYYQTDFKPKLIIGQEFEKLAQERIMKYYDSRYTLLNTNDDKTYDFELTNAIKYEVKADIMAVKTNNIFIEYEQYGTLSGISTTTASYYIIIVPYPDNHLYLLIEVLELQFLIATNRYKLDFNTKHGKGYIFDIETIKRNSKII